MNTAPDTFYAALPVFSDFTQVSDEARFAPLPDGWMVGVADVVQSTKAIKENRYKAVNMAGAAVIVAITMRLRAATSRSCSAAMARPLRCPEPMQR
jgi:cytochrome b